MLTDRPCLALALAGQAVRGRLRRALAERGLAMAHLHALRVLGETGSMSQQALIESLGIDPSAVVTVLNDLERAGLAERRRDPRDRRRHIVELPAAGRRTLVEIDRTLAEVDAELFAGLGPDELATLHRLLLRVGRDTAAACATDASCTEVAAD